MRVLFVLLVILLCIFLFIQSDWGQKIITRKAKTVLQEQFHTRVELNRIRLSGFSRLSVEGLTLYDQNNQVLAHSGVLSVHFSLLPLLSKKVVVHSLRWENLTANVYTGANDSLNYQFLLAPGSPKPGEDSVSKGETKDPWKISVGRIELEKIRLRYKDDPAGFYTALKLEHLSWRFRETDIQGGLYEFNDLRIAGLTGFYSQDYRAATGKETDLDSTITNAVKLLIKGKLIHLEDIHFAYADQGSGLKTGWQLKQGRIELLRADVGTNNYQSGIIALNSPQGYLITEKALDTVAVQSSTTSPLQVKVQAIEMHNGAFAMQNRENAQSSYSNAIDFNYLGLNRIEAGIQSIEWTSAGLTADLRNLSAYEKSGFNLKTARGKISYGDEQIALKDYLIETDASRLSDNLIIRLPKLPDGSVNTSQISITATMKNTNLMVKEALYFAPELKADTNFRKFWDKNLRLSGQLDGRLAALKLVGLQVQDNVGNDIRLTGQLYNLTDSKKIGLALEQLSIQSGKSSILAWISPSKLPQNLDLPERIDLKGTLAGNTNAANAALHLKSSFGDLRFRGTITDFQDSVKARYDLLLEELNMDAGKWIRDTSIGLIVAKGKVKGIGLVPNHMNAAGEIRVQEARLNGYKYQAIDVSGSLKDNQYTAIVNSRDSNLQTSINLEGLLKDNYPSAVGKFKITRANLQAIGLSTSPIVVKGEIDLDIKDSRPRLLDGNVYVHHVQYAKEEELLQLDSLSIIARAQPDSQLIKIEGPIGNLELSGDYDYTQLAATASRIIDFHLNPGDSLLMNASDSAGHQQVALRGELLLPSSLEKLVPGLRMRDPMRLNGRMNADSSLIFFQARQTQFQYGTAVIDSFRLRFFANRDTIGTKLEIEQVEHPSFPLHKTSFIASGERGNLDWLLSIDDSEKKPKYRVGGNWNGRSFADWGLSLEPELLMNKEEFTTSGDSVLVFRNGKLQHAALEIRSDSQSILFNRSDSLKQAAYQLLITDFQASTISSFISKDTTLAEGKINARMILHQSEQDSSITGTVKVDSLRLFGKPVGNVDLDLAKKDTTISVQMKLTGYGNNVSLDGSYGQSFSANLKMDSLQLVSIEPFTNGATTNMSGAITGDLAVEGELTDPSITGSLRFHKGKFRVEYLNNPLLIDEQELQFTREELVLNKFTLTDSTGGKATIDGKIGLEEMLNPTFQLKLDAGNFLVLGPKKNEEQMIWGPARINTTATIGGDLSLPKVDMKLKLLDKSAVGFVVPDDEPGVTNREGVIEFVNRQNPADSSLLLTTKTTSSNSVKMEGIEFTGDIEITPASTLTIIIDPYNGDFLEVKGNTSLNVKIEQDNRMTMTGVYEIDEGKYEMSLNQLIKRTFSIEKGSTITWNGDPLEAVINIRAKYQVEAPAIDLIRDQSSGSRTDLTRLRQKVPVDVYMDITDELMKPEINFELDMPEKDRNFFNGAVYTRLKQINNNESELTKQVMALLVLQTFLSENPLESLENRSGGGIGLAAKQSVSKILSQQLNNLAGSLISGIDLNFDLETKEDYMSGSRKESTVLNVGASKSLFNDRLTVSIGSNIGLFGNSPTNGAQLIGDVLIEYKLSRDGRYRIRAYQRNQTDAILLGQIIETGVSFMLVMDFNQFRQIFEKVKKQQDDADKPE